MAKPSVNQNISNEQGNSSDKKRTKKTRHSRITPQIRINRARCLALIAVAALLALVARLAYLMLVDPDDYRSAAVKQYTNEYTIKAKRGKIYDTNMKVLATSATVQNVFISPKDIENDSQVLIIASGLSDILGVDASMIVEKCQNRNSMYQMIKRSISESEEASVRKFISDNGLSRVVYLEESSKRYYPFSTLACHVLGVVGTDNTGLMGLESYYDSYLSGTDGRAVMGKDSAGNNLPFKYETYIEAEDGYGIVTTIDWTIQSVLEKYLKEAYLENNPTGKASAVIMDVNTGEILAMALYPVFDLNNYAELCDEYEALLDAFEGTDEEKEAYREKLMNLMWNNTIVTQTYEPGSTFKIITGSIAIEESAIDPSSDTFYCGGSSKVEGLATPIRCHSRVPHGTQTFKEALVNSCNPAFITIGQKVGTSTFEKYFERYGYTQKTGIDLPGETSAIYYDTTGSNFGIVELSVYSFGQTFKTTVIEHLRAVSTIANGGYLVTPHLVKSVVDSEGNTVKTFNYDNARQVISQSTADTVLNALYNSTKNASVNGYNISSKTGTSEKRDTEQENDYIASCVSFAPAEDPQIAIIVVVDDPTMGKIYGSAISAPVVSNVLSEILPYLGIMPADYSTSSLIELESYRGETASDAKSSIESKGFNCIVKGDGNRVLKQVPESGASYEKGTTVVLYTDTDSQSATVSVPSLSGNTYSQAISKLKSLGLNYVVDGIYDDNHSDCYVVKQSVAADTEVLPGTVITVQFRYEESIE